MGTMNDGVYLGVGPVVDARTAAAPLRGGSGSARLLRLRWGVRGVLVLGVAASVAANILSAEPNAIARAVSAWPPLALLLTVELISRVPVHRRSLALARWVATALIASIAAWVSYWHMVDVAARYGETGASPYLLPISVDGLVVVASICLVELGGRIREAPAAPDVPETVAVSAPATPAGVTRPATGGRGVGRPSNAEKVAAAVRRSPQASPAAIAARLNLSEATVRRHLRAANDAASVDKTSPSGQVNGQVPAGLVEATV